MDKEPLIAFFQSSRLVSFSQVQIIVDQFEEKRISKNEFFLQEGSVSNEYLFLQNGFMRAFAHNTEGMEITTNFYSQNQVVFEVSSFFTRTKSQENILALSDCQGWYISYEQLNELFHSLPAFREFGRYILVKGFSSYKNRVLSMITDTAEQRYRKLLSSSPEVFMHAPLKTIATYLGITDTSLSRIRKNLQESRQQ